MILLLVILLPSVFSCKVTPVTETYYETRYRTERYIVTEMVPELIETQHEIDVVKWWRQDFYVPAPAMSSEEKKKEKEIKIEMLEKEIEELENPSPPRRGLFAGSTSADNYSYEDEEYPKFRNESTGAGYIGFNIDCNNALKSELLIFSSGYPRTRFYDVSSIGHPDNPIMLPNKQFDDSFKRWLSSYGDDFHSARFIQARFTKDPEWINENEILVDVTGVSRLAMIPLGYYWPTNMQAVLICTREVVREKEITKERQVPYQVEKQRTLIQKRSVPLGEHINALLQSRQSQIAYIGLNSLVYTMNSDGSNQHRLDNLLMESYWAESGPSYSWSPDGDRIAFSYNYVDPVSSRLQDKFYGIYTIDTDGTNQMKITDGGFPEWSPNGKKIAFIDDYNGNDHRFMGTSQVYIIDSNGRNRKRLTMH